MTLDPDDIPHQIEQDDAVLELSGLAVGVEERLSHYKQASNYREQGAISEFTIKRFEDVDMRTFDKIENTSQTVFAFYFKYPIEHRRSALSGF